MGSQFEFLNELERELRQEKQRKLNRQERLFFRDVDRLLRQRAKERPDLAAAVSDFPHVPWDILTREQKAILRDFAGRRLAPIVEKAIAEGIIAGT